MTGLAHRQSSTASGCTDVAGRMGKRGVDPYRTSAVRAATKALDRAIDTAINGRPTHRPAPHSSPLTQPGTARVAVYRRLPPVSFVDARICRPFPHQSSGDPGLEPGTSSLSGKLRVPSSPPNSHLIPANHEAGERGRGLERTRGYKLVAPPWPHGGSRIVSTFTRVYRATSAAVINGTAVNRRKKGEVGLAKPRPPLGGSRRGSTLLGRARRPRAAATGVDHRAGGSRSGGRTPMPDRPSRQQPQLVLRTRGLRAHSDASHRQEGGASAGGVERARRVPPPSRLLSAEHGLWGSAKDGCQLIRVTVRERARGAGAGSGRGRSGVGLGW